MGLLVALPVVLLVAVIAFVHTEPGERWAAARLAAAVGGEVEGLRLAWPLQPNIARLTLTDGGGRWLEARGLAAAWSPRGLLRGTFVAHSLTAESIDVARLPEGGGGAAPRLPLRVEIEVLAARIALGEAVAGQAMALTISGSARATGQRIGVDLAFRRTDTPGGGTAVVAYDGQRLAVDIATDESLGAVFAAAGLPPLALRVTGDGPVADWRGNVTATSGGATCLAADIGLAGDRWAASGTTQRPCLPTPEPVRFTLDGTLARPSLTAQLESAAYGGTTASFSARRDGGDWLVAAQARATRLPGLGGAAEVSIVGSVAPAAGVARIAHFGVDSEDGRLVLAGTVGDGGHAAALRGFVSVPSLGRLAPALAGRGFANVAIRGDLVARQVSVAVAGSAAGFTSGDARIDQVVGSAPRLRAAVALAGEAIPMVDATVTGTGGRLRIGGTGAPLALGWRLEAAAETMRIDATGIAAGRFARPRLTASTKLTGPVEAVAGIGSAGLDGGRVQATVRRGTLAAELSGDFRLGDSPALTGLQIVSGADRLTGELHLRPGGTVAGRIAGTVADLAPWSSLAGMPLAGQATLAATLSAADGRQVAEGRIEARQLDVAGLSFEQATLEAEARGEAISFRIAGRGDAALDAAGSWRGDAIRLARLHIERNGHVARATEPATLSVGAAGGRIDRLVLDLDGGHAVLAGGIAGGKLDARLDLSRVPMQAVEALLPGEKLRGSVDGHIRLGGTLAAPQASAELRGRDLAYAGSGRETIDADVTARWQDGTVRLDAAARGSHGASGRLEGSFPLVLDGARPRLPENGAVRARLTADADIGQITDALPISRYRFAGALKADLSLSGTVADPRVAGVATVTNGYYQFYQAGLVVRNIEARLTAEDTKRFRLGIQGGDGGDGRAAALGVVRLDGALLYDVAIDLERFRIADIDTGNAIASGRLELHGADERGRLAGRLDVGPAEFNIAEHLPGGRVPRMEVIEINKPGAPPAARNGAGKEPEPGELRAPFVIDLDVGLRVNRLFVRGRGLESAWSGDLVLGGTDDDPTLAGTLRADRGSYDLIGRSFRLTDSRVVFDGGTDINPRLDVVAEASAYDITAQVRVTGTADQPEFDFTSTPAYPKDEILAHLLFGRQVGQLSIGQQVQLARAAASLSGTGGGLDPVGGLRRVLGLDLLDIGTDDDSSGKDGGISPRVTVGKYLDEDTFVKVEEGGQKGGRVAIERQVGRGLSVEAGVGQRGGGTVGLNWRMDY